MTASGYSSEAYTKSLSEFGAPLELRNSGGWLLERKIDGTTFRDAMGPYPLFSCADPAGLPDDIAALDPELASVTLVTDPMTDFDPQVLLSTFPDICVPFKENYVIDFEHTTKRSVSRHHRKYAAKAVDALEIEVVEDKVSFLDDWMRLHSHLVNRHSIKGIRRMSREAFRQQLAMPDMVVICAKKSGIPVAATTNIIQGNCAQAHILGCTQEGYTLNALYGIIMLAFDILGPRVRYYNLMGVPGEGTPSGDNIKRFKEGWAADTRTSYLCGKIVNSENYAQLCKFTETELANYFPKYRYGEY